MSLPRCIKYSDERQNGMFGEIELVALKEKHPSRRCCHKLQVCNNLVAVPKMAGSRCTAMIQVKRAYEPPSKNDGARFLVERLWPRGIKKEDLPVEDWLKDVAPSAELRRWFHHDPAKWREFRQRYFRELERNPDAWQSLLTLSQKGRVSLVYSSHDAEHNNAIALKEFLESKMNKGVSRKPA